MHPKVECSDQEDAPDSCVNGGLTSEGCIFQNEGAFCDCVPGWTGSACNQGL